MGPADQRVTERTDPGRIEIVVAEDRTTSLPVAVLASVWAAMLLAWCLFAARIPGLWCMWIGTLAHLAVGAILAHRALRGALGRSHLTLDARALVCERRPVPPRQRIELPLPDLSSFAAVQRSEGLVIIGFLAERVERWTVEVQLKPEAGAERRAVRLPVDLPSETEADRLARRLDEAVVELRTPSTYRE